MDELDNKENSSNNSEHNDESSVEEQLALVKKEKKELKDLQKKMENDKVKFREDQKDVERIQYSDPTGYSQKNSVLKKV